MDDLFAGSQSAFDQALSPLWEMAAYEALWQRPKSSFKAIADFFRSVDNARPSEFVPRQQVLANRRIISEELKRLKSHKYGICINNTLDYPIQLRDARHPVEAFYYIGDLGLAFTRSIAIVGSRKASDEGTRRARKLAQGFVRDGFTVVSGLAEGIDTAAHEAAMEFGGNTIGVLGTPINQVYPQSNQDLQNAIGEEHLLISQVPFIKYGEGDYRSNRVFFPQRNITMSALTEATVIIVEASDTSGTLFQARAALAQNRKLFVLESCFQRDDISWPELYESKGAIRVREYQDIKDHLGGQKTSTN